MREMCLAAGLLVGLLPSTVFAQEQVGLDDGGEAIFDHGHGGVQLLRSFYFNFQNGDHHLSGVGVSPDQPGFGQLEINYAIDWGVVN